MDYEQMGAFYLGKTLDGGETVLYDAKDLTTHAVIIGMTGSGKTGLGIGLLEEALVDNIPLIAVDPKGDLANLLLTFPNLTGESFAPWVNPREATEQGQTKEQYAAAQAKLWKKGLADWGQDESRITKLRESVDMAVYTPGSTAGLQVSVLRSFSAPPPELREDADLWRERVQSTASNILALLGEDADPVTSREHILLSNILESSWKAGKDLDLAGLIGAIQQPPFSRIGVLDLDQFYPQKDRFNLAMKLNNLLAAPGFETWLDGEPLNVQKLLYTENGKARASIFSIAHLNDSERMFFVTTLLNEVLGWMRSQKGTGSLRALLYIDEIFGYLPPSANPPSKTPLLTLLKQARAFGLGLVLSTQNPVDLDYKALSNAGTWFIGRLQTERDKARVLEGLEGAAAGEGFNKAEMERTLAGLGKREFLLHNVHEDAPVTFTTRWVMSYLSGPMTREQIKVLMADRKTEVRAEAAREPEAVQAVAEDGTPAAQMAAGEMPVMPDGVPVYYAPASGGGAGLVYYPAAAGLTEINYSSATHGVNQTPSLALAAELSEGPVTVDWDDATELGLAADDLQREPLPDASFADLPKAAASAKAFAKWQKDLIKHIRQDRLLKLYKSKKPRLTSAPGVLEADFRAEVALALREERDAAVAKLRKKYADKVTRLEERLDKARYSVERESSQVRARQMDTALNVGTAVLSAVLGRKRLSVSSVSRATRAAKSAGRVRQDQLDVDKARETVASLETQLGELNRELESELAELQSGLDASSLDITEVFVKANSTDITLDAFMLLWLPYRQDAKGRLTPDWPQ